MIERAKEIYVLVLLAVLFHLIRADINEDLYKKGFCERIARQTANLVRTNQYPHTKSKNKGYTRRGRRSPFSQEPNFLVGSNIPVEYVDYEEESTDEANV